MEFILDNDERDCFSSAYYHINKFIRHFNRLVAANQILVFFEGELLGVCSWARVWEKDLPKLNKISWDMPEDITTGDILYIDTCVLKRHCDILKIKDFFEKSGFRKFIREVLWFDVPRGKVLRKNTFKKGD